MIATDHQACALWTWGITSMLTWNTSVALWKLRNSVQLDEPLIDCLPPGILSSIFWANSHPVTAFRSSGHKGPKESTRSLVIVQSVHTQSSATKHANVRNKRSPECGEKALWILQWSPLKGNQIKITKCRNDNNCCLSYSKITYSHLPPGESLPPSGLIPLRGRVCIHLREFIRTPGHETLPEDVILYW